MNVNSILIVGGGTAGWMAACLMAHRWQSKNISIALIESLNIGTIGVGEGSTPFLRDFFADLGIAEATWMPECDATYKCGIDFPNWYQKDQPSSFFHPFYGEADSEFVNDFFASCQQRREGFTTPTCPDDYFISAYLAKQNKAPLAQTSANQESSDQNLHNRGVDYGYHFDAAKLGLFLAKHARSLGVKHIRDEVTKVTKGTHDITGLETKLNGQLRADFYVDCSGLKGLLIQQTLGEKLIDYEGYLANNAAVAISTQLDPNENAIPTVGTYTLSKAMQYGWMWSIPLQSRMGNGYVYSDKHISKEQVEQALREELGEYDAPALHLAWQPGRIENHWQQNCVAIGLSQGFLEPLEAPMLNLVQQSCESFIEHIEKGDSLAIKQQFNTSINLLIDGTRDYLQAHYLLNNREDSQYWIKARENTQVSDILKDIIQGWDKAGIFEHALAKHAHKLAYAKTSWYCIFAGMERFQAANKGSLRLTRKKHDKAQLQCATKAKSYPQQKQVLSQHKLEEHT